MTISLATACRSTIRLQDPLQRQEAIQRLPERARDFISAIGCTPETLVSTKGLPFELFKELVKYYMDHRGIDPNPSNELMRALGDTVIASVEQFGAKSPHIKFAKETSLANKLIGGQTQLNSSTALKLIESCVQYDPEFLSPPQKEYFYGAVNKHAPHLLPNHSKNNVIRKFVPVHIINPDRIIEILHETGEDPVYLAELCLNRDRNAPLALTTKASSNYSLKQHFIRAGQWPHGPQTCVAVSGKDLEGNEFVITSNGTLVTVDKDPIKITESDGQSLITTLQLGRRIKEAQKLMQHPAPGTL